MFLIGLFQLRNLKYFIFFWKQYFELNSFLPHTTEEEGEISTKNMENSTKQMLSTQKVAK